MDQLKQILSQAAKHQFWIVTGVAVVLSIAGFFMARSTINNLYTDQATALDSHYTNIQNVRSAIPKHPNEGSQAEMQVIIDGLADDVKAAWQIQYDRQAQYLQWPEAVRKTNPSLVRALKAYTPVERKLEFPNEPRNISDDEKRAYNRYFDKQMPELAKIIGVEWVGQASKTSAAGGMAGGMGGYGAGYGAGYGGEGGEGDGGYGGYGGSYGGEGMGAGGYGPGGYGGYGGAGAVGISNKPRDLVTWPKPSQDELLNSIRLWSGDTPSVYQILYTQENMWILEGLLNIIKETNGDALANFQCAIREIEFIRIGRTAIGKAGMIDGAGGAAGGMYGGMGYGSGGYGAGPGGGYSGGGYSGGGYSGGGYSGEGGGGPGYGGEDEGGYGGEGEGGMYSMGGGGGGSADPAQGRYVDANFAPVSGEDLRTKMSSDDPQDAYFAVAKRVPVRLRFKIDQRKVQTFLANCGNAGLMLEVRQVRLGNTPPAASSGGGGGGGGYGGYGGGPGLGGTGPGGDAGMGGPGYGAGYGGEGGYGGGGYGAGGYGAYGGGTGTAKKDPWVLPIEVYGIVYLFNPVDIQHLGLEKVTEGTELSDTVDTPAEPVAPAPAANDGDNTNTAPAGEQPGGNAGAGSAAGSPAGQPAGNPDGPTPGAAGGAGAGAPANGGPGAGGPGAGGPGTGGAPATNGGAAGNGNTPPSGS